MSTLLKSALGLAAISAALTFSQLTTSSTSCNIDKENSGIKDTATSSFPTFTIADVAKHDGKSKESNGKSWVTVGNDVYDITEFIASHPGGASKIKLAAGKPVEEFWSLFPFHFDLLLVKDILKTLKIGVLDPLDVAKAEKLRKEQDLNNPFSTDPKRHPALILHSTKPCNAEVPDTLLTESYITPSELFFIRHHHPVPVVKDVSKFRLTLDGVESGGPKLELSMSDLSSLPQHEITATIQCSGNRRAGMNEVQKASGSPWVQGAISTAKWRGPRLVDVLKLVSKDNDKIQHVIFTGLDGMCASIPKHKALSEFGDVILATHMNGEVIPAEHGYPLRAVVPGHVGVRNVKWVKEVKVSMEEAVGDWQRGLNYKVLPPGAANANGIDISKLPAMQESSVFSAISGVENNGNGTVDAKGWAFAGGGRGIARVDVTTDGGKTWHVASITEGGDQATGREWAWVFWEANDMPIKEGEGGLEVASRAVDTAYNSQPEECARIWNMRGLGNNSWYKRAVPPAV